MKDARAIQKQIFTHLLRDVRLKAGLRQAELAVRLGMPQSSVSKMETGERSMDILELRDFCGACGWTLVKFVEALEERLARVENSETDS